MQTLTRSCRRNAFSLRRLCKTSAGGGGTAEVEKSGLYTRGGDSGYSSLFDGTRTRKDATVFSVLGSLDEANAHLGLARSLIPQSSSDLKSELSAIQSALLDAGASVATPLASSSARSAAVRFDDEMVVSLERSIDRLDAEAGKLTSFILPGGGRAAATMHVARAVVRRAEREVASLVLAGEADPNVGVYVNRLSDYVFAAARVAAKRAGEEEVLYVSRRKRDRRPDVDERV